MFSYPDLISATFELVLGLITKHDFVLGTIWFYEMLNVVAGKDNFLHPEKLMIEELESLISIGYLPDVGGDGLITFLFPKKCW